MSADAIETVVLRRGELVIKPTKVSVIPETIQNSLGAKRELTSGSFAFPFDAFRPEGALTITFVGRRDNFEWTLSVDELRALK